MKVRLPTFDVSDAARAGYSASCASGAAGRFDMRAWLAGVVSAELQRLEREHAKTVTPPLPFPSPDSGEPATPLVQS